MSRDTSDPSATEYRAGLAQGREVRLKLPKNALSPDQRVWMSGFIAGLLGLTGEQEQPEPGSLADAKARDVTAARRSAPAPRHVGRGVQEHSSSNPFAARLTRIAALPGAGAPRAFQLTANTEGNRIGYTAGDQLGVSCQNDPDAVRAILRRLSARGQEEVTTQRGVGPAWRALLEEVDVEKPTRELVELLADAAHDRDERRTLESMAHSILEGGTVRNLLRRFPSARPRVAEVVAALHPIEPTLHPIASSPLAAPDAVELLVRPPVEGVRTVSCGSPRLFNDIAAGKLRKGDWLPIFVVRRPELHLPLDSTSPIVFVGTAAATFRALLQHRSLSRSTGRNWIFLSSEPASSDIEFRSDFEDWARSRLLTRFETTTGGPSELPRLLMMHGEMLARWLLDQSLVYIEVPQGDTQPIEDVLSRLLERHGGLTEEAARARIAEWRGGRVRVAS